MVTGYHGTTISVEPKTKEGLYICNSSDVSITVAKKCAKTGIEACKNVSVYFNAPVMTEMCEIVSCENIDLYIRKGVTLRTITIDMSSNVNIHVQSAGEQLFKVYYHQSSDTMLIKHGGGPAQRIQLDTLPAHNEKQTRQFVCRIHPDDQIQIDPVVREGKGYPTTAEELAAHAETELIFLQRFRDQINIISRLQNESGGESSGESPP